MMKHLKLLTKQNKLSKKEGKFIERCLKIGLETKALENKYKRAMEDYIVEEKIYTEFLSHVKGIGAVISCNLIKLVGYCEGTKEHPEYFSTVSKLWAYAGVGLKDGNIQRRKKGEHINYNPDLKKLCWLIADSFIKQNSPIYRGIYDREKKRQEENRFVCECKANDFTKEKDIVTCRKCKKKYSLEDTENKDGSKRTLSLNHSHFRAMRKTVKMFLQHYWCAARELTNQAIGKPYVFGDAKHTHYITWKDVIEANKKLKKKPEAE